MPHAGAGQGEAEGALPPSPVISHSKRMAVNAAANRALAPQTSKLLELETQVKNQPKLGEAKLHKTAAQSMRVWPGLRLIGAGGKIPRGSLWPWRKWSRTAVTYASCHNRVRLGLESCHLTLRHLPQPHVPGLHKRAALRRENSGAAQRSKSILHLTCLPLALTLTARCSWLSSSVRALETGDAAEAEEDTAASALLLRHEFLDGGFDDVTLATLGEVLLEPTLTTLGNFLVGGFQLEGYAMTLSAFAGTGWARPPTW